MNNNCKINEIDNNIGLRLKNGVTFGKGKIYNKLHSSNLLDKRLDEIKKYFKKKYNIFYFSIEIIDIKNEYYFGNMDHDAWHMFGWMADLVSYAPELNQLISLNPQNEGVMFMPPITKNNKKENLRATVMGQEKNGLEFMFCNSQYRIMYSILFNQYVEATLLDLETYKSLVKDLRFTQSFLDPFMDYFKIHRNIDDSKELNFMLDHTPLVLPN